MRTPVEFTVSFSNFYFNIPFLLSCFFAASMEKKKPGLGLQDIHEAYQIVAKMVKHRNKTKTVEFRDEES